MRASRTQVRCTLLALLISVTAALGTNAATASASDTRAKPSGAVNVLYAASLQNVVNAKLAPAFKRATGYTLEGFPAGSSELAAEIKSKTRRGDVFISAAPSVNASLNGARNGNWVSWYVPFASTSLVLGYNPHSSFVRALRTRPWYRVVDRPGFRLGFTDPKLDPKGVLAADTLKAAGRSHHEPPLRRLAGDQNDMFPEQSLIGELQSGQLDAAFFYTVEARAAHIPTVSLGHPSRGTTYTLTILHGAPHAAAARALVRFLLGHTASRDLRRAGLRLQAPAVHGRRSSVPAALRRVFAHAARRGS